MGIVIWPVFFLLFGVLFGVLARKAGWAWVAVPLVLGALDIYGEGLDAASVVMILVSTALAAIGVMFGIALDRQRGTTPHARRT